MFPILEKIHDFNLGDGLVRYVQIFCLLTLIIFFLRSVWLLGKELYEGNTQGVFPALGVSYMLLSVIFILIFIGSFDEIMKYYMQSFVDYYGFRYGESSLQGKYILDEKSQGLLNFAKPYLQYTLLAVLCAFSCNFSKSFFTLNSLELGLLKREKVANIFSGWQKILEGCFRLGIAFIFILIEKELAEITTKPGTNYQGFFGGLASQMIFLYSLLIIWYSLLVNKLWGFKKFGIWKWATPAQFLIGLILAISYLNFSKMDLSNVTEWTFDLISNSKIVIGLSLVLIFIIAASEILSGIQKFRQWRQSKNNQANESPKPETIIEKAQAQASGTAAAK